MSEVQRRGSRQMKEATCSVLIVIALAPILIGCGRRNATRARSSQPVEKTMLSAELASTWDDLMLLHAAKAVARDDVEFGTSLGNNFEELKATLSPRYLKDVPL